MLARVLYGGRNSLLIGFAATMFAAFSGIVLLKEAGYEPGQLTLKIIVGAGDKQRTSAAEIIGSYLGAVGITLEIKSLDIATYAATIENSPKEWDMWLRNFGSSMGAAPSAHDFFATTLFKVCHLDSQENAAKMKELAQQMGQAVDENARLTTYKELQEFYLNDCLYTYPLVESIFYTLVNSNLKNAGRVGQDEWMITNAYFE